MVENITNRNKTNHVCSKLIIYVAKLIIYVAKLIMYVAKLII
jgi:hypothetical protein